MSRTGLCAAAATLTLAAPAQATADPASVARALEIADRWAAKDAPHHVNHCAGGRMALTFADEPMVGSPMVDGFADGWAWDGVVYRWDHAACRATIRSGMPTERTCEVIAHELMHFVIGPQHVGPLDPRHPGADCSESPPHAPANTSGHASTSVRRKRARPRRSCRSSPARYRACRRATKAARARPARARAPRRPTKPRAATLLDAYLVRSTG
ncbi:MAG: hypothetical protein M3N47_02700 [Chloroflexota bacterium]|nr:hypothetical protein [Chloroflexota bacterium]